VIQEVIAGYSMTTPLRAGTGTARHHHGEILQGACRRAGTLIPCLITMPGRGGGTARYVRMAHEPLQVLPRGKIKAAGAARLALEHLDEAPCRFPTPGRWPEFCSTREASRSTAMSWREPVPTRRRWARVPWESS
jgi:hypothetical protein